MEIWCINPLLLSRCLQSSYFRFAATHDTVYLSGNTPIPSHQASQTPPDGNIHNENKKQLDGNAGRVDANSPLHQSEQLKTSGNGRESNRHQQNTRGSSITNNVQMISSGGPNALWLILLLLTTVYFVVIIYKKSKKGKVVNTYGWRGAD